MEINNTISFKLIVSIIISFVLGVINIFLGTYLSVVCYSLTIINIFSIIFIVVNTMILTDKTIAMTVIKISSFLISSFVSEIFMMDKYYFKICEFVYNVPNVRDELGFFVSSFLLVKIILFSIISTILISLFILFLKNKIQAKNRSIHHGEE